MELKTFISQTLQDIILGVQDAQKKVPVGSVVPSLKKTFQAVEHGVSEIQAVDFEVTVRADERAGSEAKLSVVAAVIGAQIKGESGNAFV